MKLTWDETGSRLFETGVSKGVLYPTDSSGNYTEGVAWNGLVSVTVSPSGADPTPIYANNVKITESYSFLDFSGSIEAFTYPDEFADCLGMSLAGIGMRFAMQKRKRFGLAWRSKLGNDTEYMEHGYKLHILYGCMAQMSEMPYSTINQDPELMTFSWPISTMPTAASGYFSTSYVEIDSTKTDQESMNLLEQVLYGTDLSLPHLPLPEELISIMGEHEDDYIGGIFPGLDDTQYPISGFFPKLDKRRF